MPARTNKSLRNRRGIAPAWSGGRPSSPVLLEIGAAPAVALPSLAPARGALGPDELIRLTRRTSAIAHRLVRIAAHSAAAGEGLVVAVELAAMEHQVEALADVVQLQALQ